MKLIPYFAFLAGTLAATTSNAATTDPMGGMIIPIKGESDTRISVPFSRAVTFEGRIDSISSATLTISGSPSWDDGEFLYGDVDSSNPANTYYAVFLSGVKEGMALEITANDANSITVDLGSEDLTGVTTEQADGTGNGDIIQIVPYWTPATLFAGTTLPDQTQLFLYDNESVNVFKSPTILTYFDGYGWFSGAEPADDAPFNLGEGLVVRSPAGSSDFNLVLSGAVPMFMARKTLVSDANTNDIHLGVYSPVEVTLGDSGLGVQDQVQLLMYDNSASGYFKSPTILTYFDGYGWFNGPDSADDLVLDPADSYIIRKPASGGQTDSITWSYLPSYLQ